LGREVEHLSPFNIEVKDVLSNTATSLYDLTGECLVMQEEGSGVAGLQPISFFSTSIFLCHIVCQGCKYVCMCVCIYVCVMFLYM
jgi:hypothetical protein